MGRRIRLSRSLAAVDAILVHYMSDKNELRSKPECVSGLDFWQCLCLTHFADIFYRNLLPHTAVVPPKVCDGWSRDHGSLFFTRSQNEQVVAAKAFHHTTARLVSIIRP